MASLVEAMFLHSIKTGNDEAGSSDQTEWLKGLDAAPEHRDLLLLGVRLRAVVSQGDAEREMVRDILETLARFAEKHSSGSGYFNF